MRKQRRPRATPPIAKARRLENGLAHRRKAAKREHLQALQASRARDLLQELPAPGWSIHGVQRGNFNFFDIIPATLDLARPATCDRLAIATLGFNRANIEALLQLHDDGRVGAIELIASVFYRAHEPKTCAWASEQLEARGGSFHARRNHAKVIALEMSDGSAYALEGSANLRSCRMVEQFCLVHDAELVAFHRRWIGELVEQGDEDDELAQSTADDDLELGE